MRQAERDKLTTARDEAKRLRAALVWIANAGGDDCTCGDPPQDRDDDDERGNDPTNWAHHLWCCECYICGYAQHVLDGGDPGDTENDAAREAGLR